MYLMAFPMKFNLFQSVSFFWCAFQDTFFSISTGVIFFVLRSVVFFVVAVFKDLF